mgnify:CR=1 FL=1
MDPVVLDLPFRGRWRTEMSPARRVPSHGTTLFGTSHAIDFVAVDARGRSGPRSWRSVLATEAPEIFVGFGAPILAPVTGRVLAVHDAEEDHAARRSQLALVPYALTQASRARRGHVALAGNRVVLEVAAGGPVLLLAHLRQGSVRVRPGEHVASGEVVGECGSSGNSTEPHVHVQVSDSTDWERARGVPLAFRLSDGVRVPEEGEIVSGQ